MYGDGVTYSGNGAEGVSLGTHGRVLSRTAVYAHVMWVEGELKGQVTLHRLDDLQMDQGRTVTASLDDSLEVGSLISLASAQSAYEESGGGGLVSHLASGGHLAAYASVAEDAFQMIAEALQGDPVLGQMTASMDPEEADEVYRLAARALLHDSGDF